MICGTRFLVTGIMLAMVVALSPRAGAGVTVKRSVVGSDAKSAAVAPLELSLEIPQGLRDNDRLAIVVSLGEELKVPVGAKLPVVNLEVRTASGASYELQLRLALDALHGIRGLATADTLIDVLQDAEGATETRPAAVHLRVVRDGTPIPLVRADLYRIQPEPENPPLELSFPLELAGQNEVHFNQWATSAAIALLRRSAPPRETIIGEPRLAQPESLSPTQRAVFQAVCAELRRRALLIDDAGWRSAMVDALNEPESDPRQTLSATENMLGFRVAPDTAEATPIPLAALTAAGLSPHARAAVEWHAAPDATASPPTWPHWAPYPSRGIPLDGSFAASEGAAAENLLAKLEGGDAHEAIRALQQSLYVEASPDWPPLGGSEALPGILDNLNRQEPSQVEAAVKGFLMTPAMLEAAGLSSEQLLGWWSTAMTHPAYEGRRDAETEFQRTATAHLGDASGPGWNAALRGQMASAQVAGVEAAQLWDAIKVEGAYAWIEPQILAAATGLVSERSSAVSDDAVLLQRLIELAPERQSLQTLLHVWAAEAEEAGPTFLAVSVHAATPSGAASAWLEAEQTGLAVVRPDPRPVAEGRISERVLKSKTESASARQKAMALALRGEVGAAAARASTAAEEASLCEWFGAAELASGLDAAVAEDPVSAAGRFEARLRLAASDPGLRAAALLAEGERRSEWLLLASRAMRARAPSAASFLFGCAQREFDALGVAPEQALGDSPVLVRLRDELKREKEIELSLVLLRSLHTEVNTPLWQASVSVLGGAHLLHLGSADEALAELERAQQWLETAPDALKQEAGLIRLTALIQLKDFAAAEKAIEPVTELRVSPESDAQILFLAGWLELRAGHADGARRWFEEARRLYPQTRSGTQAAEALTRWKNAPDN